MRRCICSGVFADGFGCRTPIVSKNAELGNIRENLFLINKRGRATATQKAKNIIYYCSFCSLFQRLKKSYAIAVKTRPFFWFSCAIDQKIIITIMLCWAVRVKFTPQIRCYFLLRWPGFFTFYIKILAYRISRC